MKIYYINTDYSEYVQLYNLNVLNHFLLFSAAEWGSEDGSTYHLMSLELETGTFTVLETSDSQSLFALCTSENRTVISASDSLSGQIQRLTIWNLDIGTSWDLERSYMPNNTGSMVLLGDRLAFMTNWHGREIFQGTLDSSEPMASWNVLKIPIQAVNAGYFLYPAGD